LATSFSPASATESEHRPPVLTQRLGAEFGDRQRHEVPDPFDRIIAATALTLDLPLVTALARPGSASP